jgi:hypothetical protein
MNKNRGKKGKTDKKKILSNQPNCKLFNLPIPILMDLMLFSISQGKEILSLGLTCKKMMEFLFKDPRPWLSILIKSFPNSLDSDLDKCVQNLSNGYKDNSKDWKSLYILSYTSSIQIKNRNYTKKLSQYFNSRSISKLKSALSEANFKFTSKNSRLKSLISAKSITSFSQSKIVTVAYTNPVSKCGSLEFKVFGNEITLNPGNNNLIKPGNISVGFNQYAITVMLNAEIYTEYWLISYYDIAAKAISYSVPIVYCDISKKFGLQGYTFYLELYNLEKNLASVYERIMDFDLEGGLGVSWIPDLKIRVPKDSLVILWKSLAFSDKIKDIGLVEFALFSEFMDPISWGFSAAALNFEQSDGNEGDVYSLSVTKENCTVCLFFRDKGKFWVLFSVKVQLPVAFLLKIFKTDNIPKRP